MAVLGLAICQPLVASRYMENLGRGVVAVKVTTGVYVGWRMLGTDPSGIGFNVYRNGTKINGSTPITGSTNYSDTSGQTTSTYYVKPVINGVEQAASQTVSVWSNFYKIITMASVTGTYELNDAAVGDLDGDGEYEIVVKRLSTDLSATSTTFNLLEAYRLNGTLMWRINLGPNNLYAPVEINPIVYDFDGDGKAEVALRTCEGNTDGIGVQIGDTDGDGITDYRGSAVLNGEMWMTQGPEFLSIFSGQTGEELARTAYIERDPISQWGDPGMSLSQYAHRADKCMMTPAYIDGQRPSLVICRGIYHRIKMEAWNYRNHMLTKLWSFDSNNYTGYSGQGNHNLSVGDVDSDGFDEIVYGACCIDHDGTGKYTTNLGHGDAMHLGKMIPGRSGLQVWDVHETPSSKSGGELHDAATGDILFGLAATGDTGRGLAAHIDSRYRGYLFWSSSSGGVLDANGVYISTNTPSYNFATWWDGDLQRELTDIAGSGGSPKMDKWNGNGVSRVYINGKNFYDYPTTWGCLACNSTKGTPCLQADILGDWREELIYRLADNTGLIVFTTKDVTTYRFYTFMHDSQYRTAVAWQCDMYNQPPHTSFYVGAGMTYPLPAPDIVLVGATSTPTPNPMTWASVPAVTGTQSVAMTASTATSAGGVEYYFTCTSGGGHSSSWQTGRTYTDTGLIPGVTYTYAVKARDAANTSQVTASSTSASVYLNTGPIPDPMTWASAPASAGISSITMTATTAASSGGVEYYFACTAGGGHDSGWQTSTTYVDSGLASGATFTYTVKARDKATTTRVTGTSTALSATTSGIPSLPVAGAYWPLDEKSGTLAHDYSGNGNNGTLSGAILPVWGVGEYGGGLTFAANGGYVSVPHNSSIDFGDQDFSISLWLKEPATITSGTQHNILRKGSFGSPTDSGSGKRYELYRKKDANGDIFYWTIDDGTHMTELGVPASYVCTGAWVHVVAVRDSVNNQLCLYVNAVQKSMLSSVVTDIAETEGLLLGDAGMSGSIDDVRIYGTALTVDQIAAIYIGTGLADTTPPSPDPMTWVSVPAANSYDTIYMAAIQASDAAGVEYYFANVTDPNHDSGWQASEAFSDVNLANDKTYVYRVKARDKSAWGNETGWSETATATTPLYLCSGGPSTDLNGDSQVTLLDVAVLAGSWMVSGSSTAADLNADSIVDFNDLAMLADDWLLCGRMPQAECFK
jgi:rhamnogalacturonan endolyase